MILEDNTYKSTYCTGPHELIQFLLFSKNVFKIYAGHTTFFFKKKKEVGKDGEKNNFGENF